MSLGSVLNIAASGMNAQSLRLNLIAGNLSNADNAAGSADTVYRAKEPVFQTVNDEALYDRLGQGVIVSEVVEDAAPARPDYQPHHPLADDKGNVWYSNVNTVKEMVNMMSASRVYQMQVEIASTAKTMLERTTSALSA